MRSQPDLRLVGASPAFEAEAGPVPASAEVETDRALRLVARREHELLALSELSQELAISLDLFGVADLVLFNLMGQLGTSRAAIWLVSEDDRKSAILLRSHGVQKPMAMALGSACTAALLERMAQDQRLVFAAELEKAIGPAGAMLARQEGIALFAPILSRGELLGLLALGPRIDGTAYGAVELQVLQTSLGMVGVALQNTTLYNRMLENNRQLRLANEDLQELDRLKSEFLRNVNHELRTPLTVTVAYLSCLLDLVETGGRAHDFVKIALSEALKLKGLLENLLEFSSATDDRLPLQIVEGDATELLAAYYRERLPGVTEGLREFSFTAEPNLPPARYDRQRLLQTVEALVDNAIKFTPRGSHLLLRLSRHQDADGTWLRIDVEDDGPGIPPDRLPALFESFQQADGSLTRRVGGMGMGLAFAHQLAEKMGGRLDAASQLGKGSTFTLLVPAV